MLAVLLALAVPLEPGATAARAAAERFSTAVARADVALLRELLPARGKVQLRLVSVGPEEGFFSAGQVQALFRDFMARGTLRSFEPLHVEDDPSRSAIVRGRSRVTTSDGRPAQIELRLTFQPEDGRWVLREIRETPP